MNRSSLPLLALSLLSLAACTNKGGADTTTQPAADSAKVVNVYSHRHYDVDKQLFAQFTKETGIEVKVIMADDDELLSRLEPEGQNSPGDVIITADAGRLGLARQRGYLLQAREERHAGSANIPAHCAIRKATGSASPCVPA